VTARRRHTLDELARLLRQPARRLEAMLAESVKDGIVSRAAGGYRLTASAERRFGRCLRGFEKR
jgi:hypothetical protein